MFLTKVRLLKVYLISLTHVALFSASE